MKHTETLRNSDELGDEFLIRLTSGGDDDESRCASVCCVLEMIT